MLQLEKAKDLDYSDQKRVLVFKNGVQRCNVRLG